MTVTVRVYFDRGTPTTTVQFVLPSKMRGDKLVDAIGDAVENHPACLGWSRWERVKS